LGDKNLRLLHCSIEVEEKPLKRKSKILSLPNVPYYSSNDTRPKIVKP
jgi:hypothetical protein